MSTISTKKVTYAGLLIAIGIIYGDIGTSPLYVLKAILGDRPVSPDFIFGSISCIFWTLTLLTTIKYVIIILNADNNGEGGIFALFALVRKRSKWLILPAMLGGAALLADGVITPSVTVTSAIEGLNVIKERKEKSQVVAALDTLEKNLDELRYDNNPINKKALHAALATLEKYKNQKESNTLSALQKEIVENFKTLTEAHRSTDRLFLISSTRQSIKNVHKFISSDVVPVVPIVIIILTFLFLFQQFGTRIIGSSFGPIMMLWFSTLAVFGILQISQDPTILKALNPYYAYKLLFVEPNGIIILGAVFLCTTGAEALYSDLGHCGKANIRVSWIFVKTALILNYAGQGAYILRVYNGTRLPEGINPFFEVIPESLLQYGVIISTCAAVIASQALISGSYTLISEAVRLNLWPKLKIIYPSEQKGQLYIPSVNWLLCVGCIIVVLIFKSSSHMEAAYGLSITIAMLATTILMSFYLNYIKNLKVWLIIAFLAIYLGIELIFLKSNLNKIAHGGWFTIVLGAILLFIMFVWYKGRKLTNKRIRFTPIKDYYELLESVSKDETIPKFASNIVYLTTADFSAEVENHIMYSMFQKSPKRADVYWLIHVNVTDEPYGRNYKVLQLIDGLLYRVDFILGFRESQGINILFNKVVEELSKEKEVNTISRYPSLKFHNIEGDFKFIVLEKTITNIYNLPIYQKFIVKYYSLIRNLAISESKNLGLDSTSLVIEKVPIFIDSESETNITINRI